MDVTSGFRALPFSPSLCHSGPDQPTNTQVHEPGHGSALTGHHQEAPGYNISFSTCPSVLWRGMHEENTYAYPPQCKWMFCVCVFPRHQEELWPSHIGLQSTKETRDGVGHDHPSQDEACCREWLWDRWVYRSGCRPGIFYMIQLSWWNISIMS